MIYWILLSELMAEKGADNCKLLLNRPENGKYITVKIDERANSGRGEVSIRFKKETLVSHFIFPHENSTGINSFTRRLTIGDLEDAKRIIIERGIWK